MLRGRERAMPFTSHQRARYLTHHSTTCRGEEIYLDAGGDFKEATIGIPLLVPGGNFIVSYHTQDDGTAMYDTQIKGHESE